MSGGKRGSVTQMLHFLTWVIDSRWIMAWYAWARDNNDNENQWLIHPTYSLLLLFCSKTYIHSSSVYQGHGWHPFNDDEGRL
jgi:hypothetical protein